MARPSWTLIELDLAVARTNARVLDAGVDFDGYGIRALPVGVPVDIAPGENGQPFPHFLGEWWEASAVDAQGCRVAANEGLFVTHPAAAGTLLIVVSTGRLALSSS